MPGDDIILCQITSQSSNDPYALPLTSHDFLSGSLPSNSFIRPSRIFTADKNIILKKAGTLRTSHTATVTKKIIDILT
ncbi:MAG: type II toxin-antitoxin system PemK/MazF family toxin [Bacteroidia bacterium]